MSSHPIPHLHALCPAERPEPAPLDDRAVSLVLLAATLQEIARNVDLSLLLDSPGEDAWSNVADAVEAFAAHVQRCHRREWEAEMAKPGFDRSDLDQMLHEIGFTRGGGGRWRAR